MKLGLTALVVLRTVAAFARLQAGLALPRSSYSVLHAVRAQLALPSVARELLLLKSSAARELVRVQDVQHGERSGPVPGGALAKNQAELLTLFSAGIQRPAAQIPSELHEPGERDTARGEPRRPQAR